MKKISLLTIIGVFLFFGLAYMINNYSNKQANSITLSKEDQITDLENYVTSNEEDIEAKKSLAWEYLLKGYYEESIKINEEVIKEKKNDTDALHQLVVSYISTSQYEKAISTSESLLKFNNYNSVALTNLAQAHFLLGNEGEFIKNIESAIEASKIQDLEGNELQFYLNLEELKNDFLNFKKNGNEVEGYFLLSQQSFLETNLRVKALNNIIEKSPSYSKDVYILKGKLEMQLNHLEDAKHTYESLIDLYPDEEYGYFLLADILFKLKEQSSLANLSEKTKNELVMGFVNSLSDYFIDNNEGLKQLEELYKGIPDQFKQIVLYNLVSMSKENKDEKNYKKYLKLFNDGIYDEDYLISISLNPKLNP